MSDPAEGAPAATAASNDTKGKIRAFVVGNFYVPNPASLADDASLLDAGIIDSTGVLELVGFLEAELGVTVDDTEMLPENLDSIAQIAAFVARKREGAPHA